MPNFSEDPEALFIEHKRDIVERSDFDRDQRVNPDDLGEDWGEGFHVETEPVIVDRGPDGEIVRTRPLSEVEFEAEQEWEAQQAAPPIEVDPVIAPSPMNHKDREKLVRILAVRLFKEYAGRSPEDPRYNPIYDGLPQVPPGSPQTLQPIPGTKMYPATHGQVLEWLKTDVIGARAKIQNHRIGQAYKPVLSFDRSV